MISPFIFHRNKRSRCKINRAQDRFDALRHCRTERRADGAQNDTRAQYERDDASDRDAELKNQRHVAESFDYLSAVRRFSAVVSSHQLILHSTHRASS